MKPGDPVTHVEIGAGRTAIRQGAVLESSPYGYWCVDRLGQRFVIAQSTENSTWLRGHHDPETSEELRALLATNLLLLR